MDNYKQARDLVKILDEANQVVDPRLRDLGSRSGMLITQISNLLY